MLYDKIRSIAHEKGIPIYKIEDECDLARGSVGKWNTVCPSGEKVKRVADYLGVTADVLLS